MFMDYQKTEQEKHYTNTTNNTFQYDPTGLFDSSGTPSISLITPTITPLTSGTTSGSTEEYVNDATNKWRGMFKDIENHKENIKRKTKEIVKKTQDKTNNLATSGGITPTRMSEITAKSRKKKDKSDEF